MTNQPRCMHSPFRFRASNLDFNQLSFHLFSPKGGAKTVTYHERFSWLPSISATHSYLHAHELGSRLHVAQSTVQLPIDLPFRFRSTLVIPVFDSGSRFSISNSALHSNTEYLRIISSPFPMQSSESKQHHQHQLCSRKEELCR